MSGLKRQPGSGLGAGGTHKGLRVPSDDARVLIIRLSSLGDVIQATPVARAIRRARPRSHLTWLVEDRFSSALGGNPDVNDIICLPKGRWLRSRSLARRAGSLVRLLPPLLRSLRKRRFDLVIDLNSTYVSCACAMAARASQRILAWHREIPQWLAARYSASITPEAGEHAVDYQIRVLDLLGLPRGAPEMIVAPTPAEQQRIQAVLSRAGLPDTVVAIHPGASSASKCWPLERYVQLCRDLCTRGEVGVVVVGGEEERGAAESLVAMCPGRMVSLAGHATVGETAAALGQCSLFVGNDSGPMHMAEGQGVRVLCIMGPTEPHWKGPYGPTHQVIDAHDFCPHGCPRQPRRCLYRKCLDHVPVEVVLERARSMLAASRPPGRD
jgi:ADP-heptose:LPS heptosyltransferase